MGFSSIFQIGDSNKITPEVKVLAVQREHELYFGNEGDLKQFPIYREKIPQPVFDEPFHSAYFNEAPSIHVDSIKILAVSASSVVHFGSTDEVSSVARVKHIRQLEE
ncbi:spore germination protein PE [Bacillus alveayuensis]|jgi:spore germination protein PE|uniref:Spore germination protein PE n=2 Tax=Aeribacillus alveayuensis TaxID=279215 RepID=A0ABT9VNB1_9BACI|nr:spore germination protein PE [Bacillus alveayuensis]